MWIFGKQKYAARKKYRVFVEKGILEGKKLELTGGGLIRSAGGWAALKSLRRMNVHLKSDERILGDSDFVERVLGATEKMERRYRLEAMGYDFDTIIEKTAILSRGCLVRQKRWNAGTGLKQWDTTLTQLLKGFPGYLK